MLWAGRSARLGTLNVARRDGFADAKALLAREAETPPAPPIRAPEASERHPAVLAHSAALAVPPPYLAAAASTPRHFLTEHLAHIERMAAQGLTLGQIGSRFGFSLAAMTNAFRAFEDVHLAFVGGQARGADERSATLGRIAELGDTGALTFLMKTKDGFTTAQDRGETKAAPEDRAAGITLEHVSSVADRQKALTGR